MRSPQRYMMLYACCCEKVVLQAWNCSFGLCLGFLMWNPAEVNMGKIMESIWGQHGGK